MRLRALAGALAGAAGLVAALAPAAAAAVPHTVQPGETLWSIAAANNSTTRTVAAFNGLPEDAMVVAGQTIQVPTEAEGAAALATAAPATAPASGAPAPVGGLEHTVVAGESLSSVAAANGLDAATLAAHNGLAADAFLIEGQTIAIPAASASAPAATAPAAIPPAPGMGHVPSPWGELHLAPAAADSWNAMRDHALEHGVDIYPGGPLSAYRTYEQQAYLYDLYLSGQGAPANPPGTSSHETGLAVDLAEPEMRAIVDEIGSSYGWGKIHGPDEWWHVDYLGG